MMIQIARIIQILGYTTPIEYRNPSRILAYDPAYDCKPSLYSKIRSYRMIQHPEAVYTRDLYPSVFILCNFYPDIIDIIIEKK